MDPATNMYYYWLSLISIPVFYNLMLLVARSDCMAFCFSSIHLNVVLELLVLCFYFLAGLVLMNYSLFTQHCGWSVTTDQTSCT